MLVKSQEGIKVVYAIKYDGKEPTYTITEYNPLAVKQYYDEEIGRELDIEYIKQYPEFFQIIKSVPASKVTMIDARIPSDWLFYWRHWKKGFRRFGYCELLPLMGHSHAEVIFGRYKDPNCIFEHEYSSKCGEPLRYGGALFTNEILMFHDLPPIEIPPDEIPGELMTEEEQRLAKIDKELQKDLEYASKDKN